MLIQEEGAQKTIVYVFPSASGKIDIPDGVVRIEDSAFEGLTGITEVSLPDTLKSIGARAFYGCANTDFTTITFPSSLERIGDYAFHGCRYLKTINVFPASLKSIGDYAFSGSNTTYAPEITAVDLSEAVLLTKIGNHVFEYCDQLETLKLHDGISGIGEYAFRGCTDLGNITFPTSLENLGQHAFAGSSYSTFPTGRTEIDLSSTKLKSISQHAFENNCAVTTVNFPHNLESIGDSAFQYTNLASISFPNTLKSIGASAFAAGTGGNWSGPINNTISEITFPDSVEVIGASAFLVYTALTKITLPATVAYIGRSAFGLCASLEEFNINGEGSLGLRTDETKVLLISGETVISAIPKHDQEITIPEGVTGIQAYAFYESKIPSFILPATLKSVDGYAFNPSYSNGPNYTLTINAVSPPQIGLGTSSFGSSKLTAIYVPAASVDAYKVAWFSSYADKIQAIPEE
jgi:hypothetical protein